MLTCLCLQMPITPVSSNINCFDIVHNVSPFERRCTAVEWHSKYPGVYVVASKGKQVLFFHVYVVPVY